MINDPGYGNFCIDLGVIQGVTLKTHPIKCQAVIQLVIVL